MMEPVGVDMRTAANLPGGARERGLSRFVPESLRILWQNRKARVGIIIFSLIVLVAIFAPLLAPYDPKSTNFEPSQFASGSHWLGTTQSGQDVFSQLLYGTRTSLIVGIVSGGIATIIALFVGMTAGYLQGPVDDVLSFLTNLALVIPGLPLMIVIAAYAPVHGIKVIVLVIAVTGWAWGGAGQASPGDHPPHPRLHHGRRLRR